jgi:hypothetical protein
MANEIYMGREKCLIRKVGGKSKKIEDHCFNLYSVHRITLFIKKYIHKYVQIVRL